MVDGEVQGDNGVATCGVGGMIGGCIRAFIEGSAINPSITFARNMFVNTRGAMADGEVQGDNGVAANTVGKCNGSSVDTLGVSDTVNPSITVTCSLKICIEAGLVNGKCEGGDGVATSQCASGVGVNAALGQYSAAEGEAATVADALADVLTDVVLNSECEGGDGVATGQCAGGIGVGAALGQCSAAELVASAVADALADVLTDVVLDGQRQGGDGVAARKCLCGIGVGAALGQYSAAELVAAAVADALADVLTDVVPNGECQGGDAVAARKCLCGVGVGAALGQYSAAEGEASAVADALADVLTDVVLDGECQGGDAVAACRGASGVGVSSFHTKVLSTEGMAVTMADGHIDGVSQVVLDSEVQHGDAVATCQCAGGIGVSSFHTQVLATEGIAVTVTDGHIDGVSQVVLDSEVQHGDAVATGQCSGGVRVGAAFGQCSAAELVASAVADALADFLTDVVLDGQR